MVERFNCSINWWLVWSHDLEHFSKIIFVLSFSCTFRTLWRLILSSKRKRNKVQQGGKFLFTNSYEFFFFLFFFLTFIFTEIEKVYQLVKSEIFSKMTSKTKTENVKRKINYFSLFWHFQFLKTCLLSVRTLSFCKMAWQCS